MGKFRKPQYSQRYPVLAETAIEGHLKMKKKLTTDWNIYNKDKQIKSREKCQPLTALKQERTVHYEKQNKHMLKPSSLATYLSGKLLA